MIYPDDQLAVPACAEDGVTLHYDYVDNHVVLSQNLVIPELGSSLREASHLKEDTL